VAKALNRNASTIARELKRNAETNDDGTSQYNYLYANVWYLNRLHNQKGGKYQDAALTQYINARLSQRWSPEQISGRIKLDYSDEPTMRASFCSIYRWIRLQYLDCGAEVTMRRHGRKSKPKRSRFPGAKSVKSRTPEALNRQRIGDWELDTLVSAKGNMSGVLTMCDRKSRCCVLTPMRNAKNQYRVEQTIKDVSEKLPFHTVVSDQGVEFSRYKRVEAELNIPFYLCAPHSPWQKGGVENLNGLIREFFPKGANFREVGTDQLQKVTTLLNNRPRKCLAWKTPAEILAEDGVNYSD
jgi:IS30 family transposase